MVNILNKLFRLLGCGRNSSQKTCTVCLFQKVINNYRVIFRERRQKSARLAPVHGERLPFVIVERNLPHNKKRQPLIDCVVSWEDFLANNKLQINHNYYVSRQLLGALGRFFDLVPAKLNWRPIITSNICLGFVISI